MNEKDAAIIKSLAELGLHKEYPLTPDQELLFKRAVDPEEEFLHQVEQLFHVNESDNEFDNLFKNQPIDREHLFKVQRARCYELWVFLDKIVRKTKANLSLPTITSIIEQGRTDWAYIESSGTLKIPSMTLVSNMPMSLTDRLILQTKYDRMIKAKKAFEKLGGKYPTP